MVLVFPLRSAAAYSVGRAKQHFFTHGLLLYQLIESRLSGDQRVRSGPADPPDRAGEDEGNIPEEREEEN